VTVLDLLAAASDTQLLVEGIFPIPEALDGTPWPNPDLIDGDQEPLPAFPVDTLPGNLGKYVTALGHYQQIAVDVPALACLGALAVTAGHHATITGQWTEAALNLYAAPLAESGEGKSPVMSQVNAPLLQLQRDLRRAYELRYGDQAEAHEIAEKTRAHLITEITKASGDKRRRLLADLDAIKQEITDTRPPPHPRLLAGDITPESLAKIMRSNGGHIGILSSEGGFFGTISGRYNNGKPNVDLVLNALDVREPYVSDRATGDSFEIDRPSLTLVLCVQPIVIAEVRTVKALVDRGLLYRFIYSMSESMAGRRDKAPAQVPAWLTGEWFATVRAVYQAVLTRDNDDAVVDESTGEHFPPFAFDPEGNPKNPAPMVIGERAEALHLDWRRHLERRVDPDDGDLAPLKGWVKKLEGTTYRIAALLHLAAGHSVRVPVDEAAMAAAIQIAEWAIPHAMAVLAPPLTAGAVPGGEPAHRVLRWIRRKTPASFTLRDLHRGMQHQAWVDPKKGGGGREVVASALLDVMRAGWVASVARVGADGRVLSDALFVPHPELLGGDRR
jgi:hypothetical protein